MLTGLILPVLADAARPLMGIAVFVFTLGALLKVDGAAFRREAADRRGILLILLWSTFGVPLLVYGLVQAARPGPGLALGLVLCALAPPVGSAAAIAAMLGLRAPPSRCSPPSRPLLSRHFICRRSRRSSLAPISP